MAIDQVPVLGLVGNQLPNPLNQQGGQYFGMTLMDNSNIVMVFPAVAVSAALAERDKKIQALRKEIGALKAQLRTSRTTKKAKRKR
jgi:uncharacterized small protein (DUF1192 family)